MQWHLRASVAHVHRSQLTLIRPARDWLARVRATRALNFDQLELSYRMHVAVKSPLIINSSADLTQALLRVMQAS